MGAGRYLVLLACAGLLAAGCGNEIAQPPSLTRAIANTSASTAKVTVTTTIRTPKRSVSYDQRGEFDFARARGVMRLAVHGFSEEILLIPPMTYIKLSGKGASSLPARKPWIAMKADAPHSPMEAFAGPFGDVDPGTVLKSLTAISSSVTKAGTTTISAVPMTEFRVTLDPAKAKAGLPPGEGEAVRFFAMHMGVTASPVEVWVDPQNLVRRIVLSFPVSHTRGPLRGARLTQTTDFSGFGVPVRVSAPPASEVVKAPPIGRGGSSGGGKLAGPPQPKPPPVAGTLSPAQATAAEQTVRAFWTALGSNDRQAVAQTVLPSQRSCLAHVPSGMRFTVASVRILSAEPAAHARATVRFTLNAHITFHGHRIPVYPEGPGKVQWLVAVRISGHWYLDLRHSAFTAPAAGC